MADEKPKFTVNNGSRQEVSFGPFTGIAGYVERGGVTEIAFMGKLRDFKDVTEGTIDGKAYRVAKIERSSEVKSGPGTEGWLRLTVTAVTE